MAGNYNKIGIFLVVFFIASCNKEDNKKLAQDIIFENTNIIFNSLDFFDYSKTPLPTQDLKFIKADKVDNFRIEVLNLVRVDSANIDYSFKYSAEKFGIKENNFKLEIFKLEKLKPILNRKVVFKKKLSLYSNNLNVIISNFLINESNNMSSFIIEKNRGGKAVLQEIYFFKNYNNKWVFCGKKLISIG